MTVQMILAPVFAQVALVLALAVWMAQARLSAVRAGAVEVDKGSPRRFGWPDRAGRVSDAFHNQLELPVLFYVATIIALVTRQADLLFVVLGWVFVALRFVHAFEHTGRNRAKARFGLFMAGAVIFAGLWFYLALKIFLAI